MYKRKPKTEAISTHNSKKTYSNLNIVVKQSKFNTEEACHVYNTYVC
jgi:hypothetical protein